MSMTSNAVRSGSKVKSYGSAGTSFDATRLSLRVRPARGERRTGSARASYISLHASGTPSRARAGPLRPTAPHGAGARPANCSDMTRTALIAIGGNALVLDGEPGSIPRQQERAAQFAEQVGDLVVEGWTVVVSHGNGPQVGFILRRGELIASEAMVEGLPDLPLWLAVADSQGGIGHIIAVAIDNALQARGLSTRAAALITHAEVDPDDPAFSTPTKPIGSQMTGEIARRRTERRAGPSARPPRASTGGSSPAPGRGRSSRLTTFGPLRKPVPSSSPAAVAGCRSCVATPAGAASTPSSTRTGPRPCSRLQSPSRSWSSSRASTRCTSATGPRASARSGRSRPTRPAPTLEAGEFPAGSMGPKVESALQFLSDGGQEAVITSLPRLSDALSGVAGTHLVSVPPPALGPA